MPKLFALHKTWHNGNTVFYLGGPGDQARTLRSPRLLFKQLRGGDVLRVTQFNAGDPILLKLDQMGVQIAHTNWHRLGLAKKLKPSAIAAGVWRAPADVFHRMKPDQDLGNLQNLVRFRKGLVRARMAIEQILTSRYAPEFVAAYREVFDHLGKYRRAFNTQIRTQEKLIEPIVDRSFECQAFISASQLKNPLVLAAELPALFGGVRRFHSISAVFKFANMLGPGKKGNQKIKAALEGGLPSWLKRTNPWRAVYDTFKAEEQTTHAVQCGCKYAKGHIHRRAVRKLKKEILKRYYLLATQQELREDAMTSLQPTRIIRSRGATIDVRPRPKGQTTARNHVDATPAGEISAEL